MDMTPQGQLDARFSQATEPLPWHTVDDALTSAELYWLTTVRRDGRPHVTPLVGVWTEDAFVFCTGPTEHRDEVAVTTGVNTWQEGLDAVVEGKAERVTGKARLVELADAYRAKYGDDWDFDCDDEVLDPNGNRTHVYRVPADKVIAFAKSPHGQTRFTSQN